MRTTGPEEMGKQSPGLGDLRIQWNMMTFWKFLGGVHLVPFEVIKEDNSIIKSFGTDLVDLFHGQERTACAPVAWWAESTGSR